jgi:4-hydroxy-3-polyprenylbenzoate decarboxylase
MILVAITGASGTVYGVRLLEVLRKLGVETSCVVSDAARKLIKHEVGEANILRDCYSEDDLEAPFSSGSYGLDAMVIVPCSMKTLSAIANGYSSSLITRSADVLIKENRKLILVPRETPLNAIHLENMLKLARLGVTILPAMPAYYHKPEKVSDLVDFIVGKILDSLGIENSLYKRWGK